MKDNDITILKDEKCSPGETVYFESIFKDTHGAYDEKRYVYTIPKSGYYMVKKYYEAGDIIEEPEMVRSV